MVMVRVMDMDLVHSPVPSQAATHTRHDHLEKSGRRWLSLKISDVDAYITSEFWSLRGTYK